MENDLKKFHEFQQHKLDSDSGKVYNGNGEKIYHITNLPGEISESKKPVIYINMDGTYPTQRPDTS